MIKKRYISILLTMSEKELSKGIKQINSKYAQNLMFRDKLICIILWYFFKQIFFENDFMNNNSKNMQWD